jgi:hypothetical protein
MTVNWITNVYTQERSILTCSNFDANATAVGISVTNPSSLGITAKWIIPTSGVLQADLSDLVRMADSGAAILYEMNINGGTISTESISWSKAGRIQPGAAIIPPNSFDESPAVNTNDIGITAPSVMLRSFNNNVLIQFEMADTGGGYQFSTGRLLFKPYGGTLVPFTREVAVPNNADIIEFWHLDETMQYTQTLKDLECEKTYALVEWISYTGKTRRHVFEVVKLTEETTNEVSLETLTNEYDVRKERRVSFSLRLEGLTAYDYWYYSDLVTSSSVKVSLSGTNYRQVQVTAKKSTTPETSAGKPLTLEIPINYVRYDTL